MKKWSLSFCLLVSLLLSSIIPCHAGDSSSFTPVSLSAVAPKAGAVPVGTIIIWPASSNPEGWSEGKWLACNGQSVSSTSYPELAALGFSSVPNLNERVPWGVNSSPGAYREAGLPNITGTVRCHANGSISQNGATGAFYNPYGSGKNIDTGGWNSQGAGFNFDASRANAIYGRSSTVQPAAYTVRYLIRAKP